MVWVQRLSLIVDWDFKMKIFQRLTILIFIVLSVLLLNACAHYSENPYAYLPDAQTEEALVYIEQCGSCHAVPHPQRLSAAAWEDLVVVMDKRREEREYQALTKAQREKLMTYLIEHAR